MSRINRIKGANLWYILIIITIILNSGSVLVSTNSLIPSYFLVILAINALIISVVKYLNRGVKIRKKSAVVHIYVILIFCSYLVNFSNTSIISTIRYVLILVVSFLIVTNVELVIFRKISSKVIYYFSVTSIVYYILFVVFRFQIPFSTISNVNGVYYYNGYLSYMMVHDMSRNISVFWEPGIFSSIIIISLALDVLSKDFKLNIEYFLKFIALLLAKSTASYFLILILTLIFISQMSKTKSFKGTISSLLVIFSFLFVINYESIIYLLYSLNSDIFGKVYNLSGSFLTRVNGPFVNYLVYLRSPFFGNGFLKQINLWSELAPKYNLFAQTSTISYLASIFGFMPLIYYILSFKNIIILQKFNIVTRLLFLFMLIVILNKEPHQFILFSNILVMYLVSDRFQL